MSISDFLPRHLKGYLWITFLVCIFLLMALSENGVFEKRSQVPEFIPAPDAYAKLPPSDWAVASISQSEEGPRQSAAPAQGGHSEKIPADSISPVEQQKLKEESEEVSSFGGLDPRDVVIVVKTGASSIWRRMPMHMSTTLGNKSLTPNVLYYSDAPDNINGHPVIDALANVSASRKSHLFSPISPVQRLEYKDFQTYLLMLESHGLVLSRLNSFSLAACTS
jgi:hypothetical protein